MSYAASAIAVCRIVLNLREQVVKGKENSLHGLTGLATGLRTQPNIMPCDCTPTEKTTQTPQSHSTAISTNYREVQLELGHRKPERDPADSSVEGSPSFVFQDLRRTRSASSLPL